MKYFYISSFIAAIVAILLLVFYASLTKTDRLFLIFLIVVLMVGGYYFKVKDEKGKNEENVQQGISLDTTLENTKELKTKSDEIISNLKSSIADAQELDRRLKSSNSSLKKIEKEITDQIDLLSENLQLTAEFEKKLSQQLEIQKKIFDSEKAHLQISTEELTFIEMPDDSTKIGFKFFIRNNGKRPALEIRNTAYKVVMGQNKVEHVFRHQLEGTYEYLNGGLSSFFYGVVPDVEEIDKEKDIVFIITSEYLDSSDLNELNYQIHYFRFFGPRNGAAKFFRATNEQEQLINNNEELKKELKPFLD